MLLDNWRIVEILDCTDINIFEDATVRNIVFHFNSSPKATKGAFPKILVSDIKNFPIPIKLGYKIDVKISTLVDQILTAKQEDPSADTTALENEIDVLVYRLYGLTYEEVKVVDEGFWMSESEYNRVGNESGERGA